jgi:hypothetical protein
MTSIARPPNGIRTAALAETGKNVTQRALREISTESRGVKTPFIG